MECPYIKKSLYGEARPDSLLECPYIETSLYGIARSQTLLGSLLCELSAMQASQLIHQTLPLLQALLLCCHKRLHMMLIVGRPTTQSLKYKQYVQGLFSLLPCSLHMTFIVSRPTSKGLKRNVSFSSCLSPAIVAFT